MTSLSPATREIVLSLADDELLTGHRHSEWLGIAPFLEEDLAYASIAQDELGHARVLLALVTEDVDRLAYGRPAEDYRSCWLVEASLEEWSDALGRHFLYDLAESVRWSALLDSSHRPLAEVAAKALREEEYHRRHALSLMERMLTGTDESRARLTASLGHLYPLARNIFEPTRRDAEAVEAGVIAAPASALESEWQDDLSRVLGAWGTELDWSVEPRGGGGRLGVRSDEFAAAHTKMTAVSSLDPGAEW